MLQQKFTVQVTTLPDCDDITRFDATFNPQPGSHWKLGVCRILQIDTVDNFVIEFSNICNHVIL
jgi:hypothetical protein